MLFLTLLHASLALPMLLAGGAKLLGRAAATRYVTRHGYSARFARLVGTLELAGAAGIAAGVWHPALAAGGGAVIATLMLGALHAHLVRSHEPLPRAAPAATVLALACAVLIEAGARLTAVPGLT